MVYVAQQFMMATPKSTLFFCHVCSQGSTSMTALKQHLLENHKELGLQDFPLCDLVTMKDSWFIRLQEDAFPDANGLFQCQFCDFNTSKWKKWNRHMNNFHGAESVTVSASEDLADDLNSSHLQHNNEEESTPSMCLAKPDGEKPKKRFSCSLCEFSTRHSKKFVKHMKNLHSCDSQDLSLSSHEITSTTSDHETSPRLVKDNDLNSSVMDNDHLLCNGANSDEGDRQAHEENGVDNDYLLGIRTNFDSPGSQHHKENKLATDHHLRPFSCDECGQAFTRKDVLKVHMRKHTGEKPFQCPCCDFSTAYSSTLTNHLRTHTASKPYKCSQCSFSTAVQVNLLNHMRNHNDIRPYKCKLCDFSSPYMANLTAHERTHSGERPYRCPTCGKAFSLKGNMKKHEIRQHRSQTIQFNPPSEVKADKWEYDENDDM